MSLTEIERGESGDDEGTPRFAFTCRSSWLVAINTQLHSATTDDE